MPEIAYGRGAERWSIAIAETRITIHEPDGTRRVETLPSAAIARTRFRVLTNQKLRDGWKVLARVAPVTSPMLRFVEDARDPALEAAIIAEPDALENWFVYGDWLQQQGDPRGTQIALRRAALAAPDDLHARDRLRELERRHWQYLAGELPDVELGWGFIDRMRVIEPVACERALADEALRFLRELEIGHTSTPRLAATLEVVGRRAPLTLRELVISGDATLATLAPVRTLLPRLTRMELRCVAHEACFDELRTTALPRLRELGLACRHEAAVPAFHALLARDDLPALRVLHLDARVDEALLDALEALAPQLEVLSLVQLDRRCDQLFARRIARFPRLRELAVPMDMLERRVVLALEAAVHEVREPSSRFVPISE